MFSLSLPSKKLSSFVGYIGLVAVLFYISTGLVSASIQDDLHCYREKSTFPASSGDTTSIEGVMNDGIIFLQNGKVLSMGTKTLYQPRETVQTKLREKEGDKIIGNIESLFDNDSGTSIEISSTRLVSQDVVLTFDVSEVLKRDTFAVELNIANAPRYLFSVSEDGEKFVATSPLRASHFDIKAIRLVIPQSKYLSAPVRIDTFTIKKTQKNILVLDSEEGSDIVGYRKYACKGGASNPLFENILPSKIEASNPQLAIKIVFVSNDSYKEDTDIDGIENERDNCPFYSNPDQKDRNFDGKGDMCSDDDNDGKIGIFDNCPTVANADQKDQNANGVGDACEFDTDGDGIPDGADNAIGIPNPDQTDTDRDGIGDVLDNCDLFNPGQEDFNKNGIGDTCDKVKEFALKNDKDGDTILDSVDNCSLVANPDQTDTDRDGIGDDCDNCPSIKNFNQGDSNTNGIGDMCEDGDSDSIVGWKDNCPTVANPDQLDSNNDTVGDACTDGDGDEVFDGKDNCPAIRNPDQLDVDNDGIGNACDTKDDRTIESNKQVFIFLVVLVAILFLGAIAFLFYKVSQKKSQP